MLTPIQLKQLVDASFTEDGICYKRLGATLWMPFNPASTPVQIGDGGHDWIETKHLPKPQDRGQTIDTIDNSYGSLYLRQHDGVWQWGISDYNDHIDFKSIPSYLADALRRHEKERDK